MTCMALSLGCSRAPGGIRRVQCWLVAAIVTTCQPAHSRIVRCLARVVNLTRTVRWLDQVRPWNGMFISRHVSTTTLYVWLYVACRPLHARRSASAGGKPPSATMIAALLGPVLAEVLWYRAWLR